MDTLHKENHLGLCTLQKLTNVSSKVECEKKGVVYTLKVCEFN